MAKLMRGIYSDLLCNLLRHWPEYSDPKQVDEVAPCRGCRPNIFDYLLEAGEDTFVFPYAKHLWTSDELVVIYLGWRSDTLGDAFETLQITGGSLESQDKSICG